MYSRASFATISWAYAGYNMNMGLFSGSCTHESTGLFIIEDAIMVCSVFDFIRYYGVPDSPPHVR